MNYQNSVGLANGAQQLENQLQRQLSYALRLRKG